MSENNPLSDRTVSLDTTQAISAPVSDRTQMAIGLTCPVCSTASGPAETYCIDCGFLLSGSPVEVEKIEITQPAKLVSEDGIREFPLKPGPNTVGRKDSDILVIDGTVSRNHAVITVDGNTVQVTDVGSTNGTQVDKISVGQGEQVTLTDGCEVRFGSVPLNFVASPKNETPQAEYVEQNDTDETLGESLASEDILEAENGLCEVDAIFCGVLRSKDGSLIYKISKPTYTVGRRDTNDIVIGDPFCSGSHARLEYADGHVSVVDIGSSNGTHVNGILLEANQPRELAFGDELIFGQTALTYEEA